MELVQILTNRDIGTDYAIDNLIIKIEMPIVDEICIPSILGIKLDIL